MNTPKSAAKPLREPLPCTWPYPSDLPVCQARAEILEQLSNSQILILSGATGSGKSTQLPKFCLEAGLGTRGLIAHTQPRRLAARALAERVASEIGEEVGHTIGWQVRFKNVSSAHTRVKLMTDGVLLNELRRDRDLRRYDTIIIDEAHERSLNIDFLLGYLKGLSQRRPDLKIIITSATLDAEKFSRHFNGAPVIEVPGKSYPIELRYRDPEELDLNEAAARAVLELQRENDGDILIFLPGEREIRDMAGALSDHPRLQGPKAAQILPLYARLGSAHQQRIFAPGGGRRIILATNVAETSLTVPGIRHVIDTGTARVSRYNPRSKVQNLLVENIAQANADQRKGRCGRTAPGICIRLYAEDDFEARPRFPDPEIQRTNLAAVLLQMADLRLGDAEDFPFIDAPHRRYINDARRLLQQLHALKDDGRLSGIGRQLARLPVDPRFGRILLAAQKASCEQQMLPIVSILSMQDPRERDFDKRQKIEQAQAVFRDKASDFITLLNIWQAALEQKKAGSNKDFRQWCQKHYLHARRMREWQDLVRQIRSELHAISPPAQSSTTTAADADSVAPLIHQSLLYGLLDHIATHDSDGDYKGPRGARWRIHPESVLGKRLPNWIVGAEIVSTRRTYARTVAQVDPLWIEKSAGNLVSRQALEPQWDKGRGEVMAREQVSLYGLILVADRKVRYARFDAAHAKEIFIQNALLQGQWGKGEKPAFLRHNLDQARALRAEEDRQRTRGILRSDEDLLAWYEQRLPKGVCGRNSLLQHLKELPADALRMDEADLRAQDATHLDHDYPAELAFDGQRYRLRYVFAPGDDSDGVSIDIPVAQLNQFPASRLEWLVPGMLTEKLEHILKGLPKQQRRLFVPVRDTVNDCLKQLEPDGQDLYQQLARCLQRRLGRPAPDAGSLRAIELPARLHMRIRALRPDGKLLACSRNMDELRAQLAPKTRRAFQELHDERWERQNLRDWNAPDLPEAVSIKGGLKAYPCLLDQGGHVDLVLRDDPEEARRIHQQGLLRLLQLAQASRLKARLKSLPERQQVLLRLARLPCPDQATGVLIDMLDQGPRLSGDLPTALLGRAIVCTQLDPQTRSASAFQAILEQGTKSLAEQLQRDWQAVQTLATAWARWQALALDLSTLPQDNGIEEQLIWLLAPGWISRTPRLQDLPRYIDALSNRLEKLQRDPLGDRQRQADISRHWDQCRQAIANCAEQRRRLPPALIEYRWMIEEYRVSVFAQTLGTRMKVSAKRLDTAWQQIRPLIRR